MKRAITVFVLAAVLTFFYSSCKADERLSKIITTPASKFIKKAAFLDTGREINAANDNFDTQQIERIRKKHVSGIVQTVFATTFITAGSIMIPVGVKSHYPGEYSPGGAYTVESNFTNGGIASLIVGAMMFTTGLALVVSGPISISRSNKMKQRLIKSGATVSFYPVAMPRTGNTANNANLGMGLKMNF